MLVDSRTDFSRDVAARARPPIVQVILNGDNANTATTVWATSAAVLRDGVGRAGRPRRAAPLVAVEPRVWYNPELRSTLFLVPGLIAYISMITAVVSTALSIVREKERGTMEQIRMAPISTVVVRRRQDAAVPRALAASARSLIILAAMVLFGLPMRGSWLALLFVRRAVPGRRARHRPARLDGRRHPAGGVPDGAARRVPADAHAVGLHLPDREHAGGAAVHHLRRAGALLPGRAARHRAEGPRPIELLWPPLVALAVYAAVVLGLSAVEAGAPMRRRIRVARSGRSSSSCGRSRGCFGSSSSRPILQLTLLGYAATTDVQRRAARGRRRRPVAAQPRADRAVRRLAATSTSSARTLTPCGVDAYLASGPRLAGAVDSAGLRRRARRATGRRASARCR